MTHENRMLISIFPDKIYWDVPEPKEFDFIANEGLAKKAAEVYLDEVKSSKQTGIYITDDFKNRETLHLATVEELNESARGFVKEFMRFYEKGIMYQKNGEKPLVQISP